ncbi:hypothetical protein Tco_0543745 [Tanacetum coccineum]
MALTSRQPSRHSELRMPGQPRVLRSQKTPRRAAYTSTGMDKSKIARKQSKNGQARTRESEEFKKKPKKSSLSQNQSSLSQIQSKMVNKSQQIPKP